MMIASYRLVIINWLNCYHLATWQVVAGAGDQAADSAGGRGAGGASGTTAARAPGGGQEEVRVVTVEGEGLR